MRVFSWTVCSIPLLLCSTAGGPNGDQCELPARFIQHCGKTCDEKSPYTSATDLTEYAKVRAAQLAQEQVDVIMQANPALSGAFATRLLLKSTDRAVNLVLEAVANARRAAA